MPPGDAAAGPHGDLAVREREADLDLLAHLQGVAPLDEHPLEPDVDREHVFLVVRELERGPPDVGDAELAENTLGRSLVLRLRHAAFAILVNPDRALCESSPAAGP
jgi:hypothetical protein